MFYNHVNLVNPVKRKTKLILSSYLIKMVFNFNCHLILIYSYVFLNLYLNHVDLRSPPRISHHHLLQIKFKIGTTELPIVLYFTFRLATKKHHDVAAMEVGSIEG